MISTELNRAIGQFRRMYEDNVSRGDFELRMSELPQAAQDNLNKRDKELHPSSMPFCGLRAAYMRLIREPDPMVNQRFGNDYFLNAGHVFHAALQKWIGRSGQMIGDWYCHNCKHVHKFCVTPERCEKCKSGNIEYQELGGKWGKHTHWHSDGLWQAKKLWVIDYKSTSSYAIENHRKTKTVFPYTANRFQIETYIPLLEDTYGVKIAGWLLVYCFSGDSYVTTPSGKVRIKEYTLSDGPILSYNHSTGQNEFKPVTDMWSSENTEDMICIEYEGGSLTVTASHPIWCINRNDYARAGDLTEADDVLLGL